MCLVTLKVRILETKSDSFQEKYSAYKQKSKNRLAVMLHMRTHVRAYTHTHTPYMKVRDYNALFRN
jgi:tRNA-dihydrouridine synthase